MRTGKEDPMKDPIWLRWAQFRFAVIGELLSCPPPTGQLQKALDRLSQKRYRHPIDPQRSINHFFQ